MEASVQDLASVQAQMRAAVLGSAHDFCSHVDSEEWLVPPVHFTRIVATKEEEEYWLCNHCHHPLIWSTE